MDETKRDCLALPVYETERLLLRSSVPEECGIIQAINEDSDYIENWVGWKTPKDYAYKTLTEGNLPPGGVKHNFRAITVYLKNTNEPIGVLEAYCGFPSDETFVIAWLYIHRNYQKHGYAREAVDRIIGEAQGHGFKRVRLGVHLKNWPALRFWFSMGFDKIAGIMGDERHSETTFASLILERALMS